MSGQQPIDNDKREALLNALSRGLTHGQAAEAADVAPSTVTRYMKDAMFRAALTEQHLDAVDELNRILVARALRAIDVLTKEMVSSPNGPTRVRAALGIVNAARWTRDATLERQLTELEGRVGQAPNLRAI